MGIEFRFCDLWPWCYDLDLGILVDAAMAKVLMPVWPVCAGELPMRGRFAQAWDFGPVTFDLGAMTLTLGFSWMLLSKDLMPVWPICACGLPIGDRGTWA